MVCLCNASNIPVCVSESNAHGVVEPLAATEGCDGEPELHLCQLQGMLTHQVKRLQCSSRLTQR